MEGDKAFEMEGQKTMVRRAEGMEGRKHRIKTSMPLRERMKHFTWAWYTVTMSTGGIALALSVTPHRFRGLTTIGEIVFIFDLFCFISICISIIIRFNLKKGSFMRSLTHPTESLFIATFFLSTATIISNTARYGIPHTSGTWLPTALRVVFWVYSSVTFLSAVLQYSFLFSGAHLTLHSMTPAWLLPIFPLMLAGTLASVVSPSQSPKQAEPILVAGVTLQGLGFLVAVFMYSNYIGRLMAYGLPSPNLRPVMFIAVGPPSFTALALIGMANAALEKFPEHYIVGTEGVPTAQVLKIVAVFVGIFLWALAFWFFCVSVISVLAGARVMGFHLGWWAFVFPNVGLLIATIDIGTAVRSEGILWVASVVTVLLVGVWLFVGFFNVLAVWHSHILWPGRDEDHED